MHQRRHGLLLEGVDQLGHVVRGSEVGGHALVHLGRVDVHHALRAGRRHAPRLKITMGVANSTDRERERRRMNIFRGG